MEHSELAFGEIHHTCPDACLPPGQVEYQSLRADEYFVADCTSGQMYTHAREQLAVRERLRDEVARAQAEAAQSAREIRTRRQDHDGYLGTPAGELPQDGQAVHVRKH